MKVALTPHLGPSDILCIDFISDAIKAARLKTIGPRRIITDCFTKDLRSASREEVVTALKEYLALAWRRGDARIVLSAPSPLVITKNIEIPSQDPKEIKEIINLQAGRLTPYAREEVIIDYVNIGVFRQSYTKLLLVIINKDIVNKQLALFAEAGVRLDRIVLASEAIGALTYQHLRLEIQDTPFALIHTDRMATDFGMFHKGKQIFSRSIAIGAHHLTEERDKHLGRFIEELKKSLDAYQTEDIESAPTLVVFCGAIEGLKDLEVMMLDAFRMPVRLLATADIVPHSESLARERLEPPTVSMLSVAAPPFSAVSPTAINLIPDEVKWRLALEERGRDIIRAGVLVLTILVFLCASFLAQIYLKGEYLKKLNARFKTLNAEAAQIESEFSRVRIIRSVLSSRGISLNVLSELYDLTPNEIGLSNIRLRDNGVFSVKGEAASMGAVFSYLGALEKSPFFKEVKTKSTSKKKVDNQEAVDFEISGALETSQGAST